MGAEPDFPQSSGTSAATGLSSPSPRRPTSDKVPLSICLRRFSWSLSVSVMALVGQDGGGDVLLCPDAPAFASVIKTAAADSSSMIVSASGEWSCRTTTSKLAQAGTTAHPRARLLTWRAVMPASRAKAAWLRLARASNAVNSAGRSVCIGSELTSIREVRLAVAKTS